MLNNTIIFITFSMDKLSQLSKEIKRSKFSFVENFILFYAIYFLCKNPKKSKGEKNLLINSLRS